MSYECGKHRVLISMTTKLYALERLNKDESLKISIELCVVDTTVKDSKNKIKNDSSLQLIRDCL